MNGWTRASSSNAAARAQPRRIAIVLFHPRFEHFVHLAASPGGRGIGIDGVEGGKPEHTAGIESERVGLETIDLGDGDPRRAFGRAWGRPPGRSPIRGPIDRLGPFAQHRRPGHAAGHRLNPQPEARRDSGRARIAARAGDDHLRCPQRRGEIMRRQADPPFQRRQPELRTEPWREPRIGRGQGRPDPFVEPPKDHEVGPLEPRLDKAPDEQAGMLAIRRAHGDAGHHPLDEAGKLGRVDSFGPKPGSILQFRPQIRCGASRGSGPKGIAAQQRRRFAQCADQHRELRLGEGRLERCQQRGNAAPPRARGPAEMVGEAVDPGGRTRSPQRQIDPARAVQPCGSLLPGPYQWVLEHGEQGDRREPLRGRRRQGEQQGSRRRLRKRSPGAVVRFDSPAPEMRRDAPGQRSIRRHQRRRPARYFERLAHRDRDRLRLGRGIGDLQCADAGKPSLARLEALPGLGEGRRRHRVGDRPGPRRRTARPARAPPKRNLAPRHIHPVEQNLQVELRVRLDRWRADAPFRLVMRAERVPLLLRHTEVERR